MTWDEYTLRNTFIAISFAPPTTIDLTNGDILTYTKVQSKIFLKLNVKLTGFNLVTCGFLEHV